MNESKENSMIADSVSKAALLKSVQEAVKKLEMDFQAKKPAVEDLLRESQAIEQGILDMLDNRVRQLVSENTELEQQVKSLKEHLNVAEEGKAQAEKKAESAFNYVANAENKIKSLTTEKGEVEKRAKTILSEKTELRKVADAATRENEDLRKKVKAALNEKAEMERKLAEVGSSNKALNLEVANLKAELTRTVATAETAVRERAQYQDKLVQFQENWEKYIAGR
ncbi:MAG TPA: hypothetical protein VMW78_01995 [Anaerolineae bacterium]|nr:hypothetical protein [Anaerolineae bacterium]